MKTGIEQITRSHQFAIVGVSDKRFGGLIFKTLRKRGYNLFPVHPTKPTFEGLPCYASLRAVPQGPTSAVICVKPESALTVVEDAVAAGYSHLWFQQGADFTEAIRKAESAGIKTVSGKCILMYTEPVTGIHAFHRWVARLFGKV